MRQPDSYAIVLAQANTLYPLTRPDWPAAAQAVVYGIVNVQGAAGNSPSAGIHVVAGKSQGFEGLTLGPLDSHPLQHDDGTDLAQWFVWGTNQGDALIVQHGGYQ